MKTLMLRLIPRVHRTLFRLTKGRFGSRMRTMPILLLTVTGRKSGQPRTTPLAYLEDAGGYVVTASNAGLDTDPAWLLNLRADPRATVQIRDRSIGVKAEVAGPRDRERLWARLIEVAPGYTEYEKQTHREIPMVLLHPVR